MKGIFSYSVFTEADAISALLVLVATVFVFLMMAGHTLIEAGMVRFKNSHFPMLKNLLLACIAVIGWWCVGYGLGFAFVEKYVGNDGFFFAAGAFEKLLFDNYVRWNYEVAYCIVVCILFTGPLAERTRMVAFAGYAFILACFVYPVIVAWVWGTGWLSRRGFHDFAGAGVVHLVAGTSALWGAILVGKRFGRDFHKRKTNYVLDHRALERIVQLQRMEEMPYSVRNLGYRDDFRPANQVYMVTGTIIFWACYLFFTGGKTYSMFEFRHHSTQKIFTNTFLSGAAGGLFGFLLRPLLVRTYRHVSWYDCRSLTNGILAGLVSISATCDRCEPWAAVCIGIIGGIVYALMCKILEVAKIDDAVDGIPVHMGCGAWGLLAAGFFDNSFGIFYGDPGKGYYFAYQVCGIVVIFTWTSCFAFTYFLVMKTFNMLRLDMCYEIIGYDTVEMGGVNALDLLKIHEELRYRLANDEKKEKEMMYQSESRNLQKVNAIKLLLNDPNRARGAFV